MNVYVKISLFFILFFTGLLITLSDQPGNFISSDIDIATPPGLMMTSGVALGFKETITTACLPGGYVSSTGELAALTSLQNGNTRYTFFEGARGVLGEEDAVLTCRDGDLFGIDGTPWQPVKMRITRTRFESDGTTLTGELIEPIGVENPPLVVLAHGSENIGWLGGIVPIPYLLAADGLSVFIFDKRGTGLSGGEFHMNFRRLADDLVEAANEARRLADGRYSGFGLMGFSQGGWVAPLAALEIEPDFLVVGFGLAVSPQEEDAEVVQSEMRAAGYGPNELARAREVTDATGMVMTEGVEHSWDRLEKVRRAYSGESWFSGIRGEFTGRILAMSEDELRDAEASGDLNPFDVEYDYDTRPVLAAVTAPLLWIAAGADRVAPPEVTLERLERLRNQGHHIEIAVFPGTDHGMREFEELPDGSRVYGGITSGYFALLADWSRGCLVASYGRAALDGVESRRENCN